MRIHFLTAIGLVATTGLSAQSKPAPINTDRPDFTESSTLVPAHRLQFESGYTWMRASRNSGGGGSSTWPEFLVRYGLSTRFELRLGESFTTISPPTDQGSRFTARDDLYVGLKIGLAAQQGSRPKLAILVQAMLPTGDGRMSAHTTLPGVAFLAGWGPSRNWSLDLGVEANRVTGDAFELAPSASLSHTFSGRVGGFAELYAFVPMLSEPGAPSPQYADVGLSLLLSNNLQIDGRIGAGLGGSADRYVVGFGFAIRR